MYALWIEWKNTRRTLPTHVKYSCLIRVAAMSFGAKNVLIFLRCSVAFYFNHVQTIFLLGFSRINLLKLWFIKWITSEIWRNLWFVSIIILARHCILYVLASRINTGLSAYWLRLYPHYILWADMLSGMGIYWEEDARRKQKLNRLTTGTVLYSVSYSVDICYYTFSYSTINKYHFKKCQ